MKKYQLLIDIEEGSDEFWEGLKTAGNTGCDEVLDAVRSALDHDNLEATVVLTSFTDK